MASGSEAFSLEGKTYLIAGGTRGIGQAISLRFARAGANVVANYLRDEKSASLLAEAASKESLQVSLCRADLSTDKGLAILDSYLGEQASRLSGCVFSAATGIHRPVDELTERHFDWTFGLNVRAFFKLMKMLKPRFSEGSSVVAISSWGAERAIRNYAVVGASKGALEALARHLAVEFAPGGIRVNILTAGAVATDIWNAIPDRESRLAETIQRTPTGRLVTAEEVASAAQFLCSSAASSIVGHTLVVDGGWGIMA